jgi:CCR4-NOT transcription complex subunit 1
LEIRPFAFAIDLAALASRREYLNLEKWLQDRINERQLEFVQVWLEPLRCFSNSQRWMMTDRSIPLPRPSNRRA